MRFVLFQRSGGPSSSGGDRSSFSSNRGGGGFNSGNRGGGGNFNQGNRGGFNNNYRGGYGGPPQNVSEKRILFIYFFLILNFLFSRTILVDLIIIVVSIQ